MRLDFHVVGQRLVNTVEIGAVSHKRAVDFDRHRLGALSDELRAVLGRANRADPSRENLEQLRRLGERLCNQVVHPETLQRLPESGGRIHLHVDEQLVAIPWELIHDGEDFWCRRFSMGRSVSTPQRAAASSRRPPPVGPLRMLVICSDPRGDIPSVSLEGESLVERLDAGSTVDADLLVDPDVETVRRRLKEYDIVHFAGHAEHDRDHPEASGWRFADGLLTAADVMQLAGGRPMPTLVFSNACRSGETEAWDAERPAGSAPPVFGLLNAFLLAGVRIYVGTQWEIVDAQGAELALAFYAALGRGGDAGTAMRVARRELVAAQGAESLSWASYALYGDPGFAVGQAAGYRGQDAARISQIEPKHAVPFKRRKGAETGPFTARSSPGAAAGRSPTPSVAAAGDFEAATADALATGSRASVPPPRRQRLLFGMTAISVLAALLALGIALELARRPSAPTEKLPEQQLGGAALEPAEAGKRFRPAVALLIPAESSAHRCIAEPLQDTRRFRLLRVPPRRLQDRLTRSRALQLGRDVEADLVIFSPDGKQLALVDVLTGQQPLAQPLPRTETACRALVREMRRLFCGEGRVTGKRGQRLVINLGWRSRVAPGMRLEVLSADGGASAGLVVEHVEIDRSYARGQASVGDAVRVPQQTSSGSGR